jgi:membrane-anchored protein YejM (alkaline phosphatase superfamily)
MSKRSAPLKTTENQGSSPPSRPACGAEALLYLYTFNVLLLVVVGHGYLGSVPAGTSALGWLATALAFVANFAMLALAPLLLAALALVFRRLWVTLTAGVILYTLLAVFIYADSVIYQLWRFHFNSMVLNLLTTPGAGDSVTAGKGTVTSTILVIALLFLAELGFALYVYPMLRRRPFAARLCSNKALGASLGAIAILIVLDKAVYDVGDFRNDVEILRVKNLLPLYQTITMKKFANKTLGFNISPGQRLKFKTGSGSLNYPKTPLRFSPDGRRPNVLVIAIEGARFDMLAPEVMPNLWRWGESNLVCEANYSGGNTTRYGIFGLLYGIYGSYWQRALA